MEEYQAKKLKNNIYFKIAIIITIALLLLIPSTMIKYIVKERESTQRDAIWEVSSKWGNEQTLTGPILSIPYYRYIKQSQENDTKEKTVKVLEHLHILPENLNITAKIKPERRYRGIYEIVVYNTILEFSGNFNLIDFSKWDVPLQDINFNQTFIAVGISDLRGIKEQVNLRWDESSYLFNPGVSVKDVVGNGISTNVDINHLENNSYDFYFNINLNGSQILHFTPVGKVTDVHITSDWNNPSFSGAFLPDSRNISEKGFEANWNILHLNREYPQAWVGSGYNLFESEFGVNLLLPVDSYQKTERTIKYAILFITFTFITFFFIEVLNKIFIHPVQYILVGIALVVFFTLLLSISEHIRFNNAYIISSLSTLLLIAAYIKAIIKSSKLTFLISGILLILYLFIFVIIQLQDYALLIGSIGVFVILAIVMYFSRKIDWYNIRLEESKE